MQDQYNPKRRLSDILAGRNEEIRGQWDQTEAAQDFAPVPAGTYEAHVDSLELANSRRNCTPSVMLTFRIAEGEHAGRLVWHDLWLTPAALPRTKRDCVKLGLNSLDEIENATVTPGRIRCKVRVALRRDDDGNEHNDVRRFDVLRIDEPGADPFTPVGGSEDEPPVPTKDAASEAAQDEPAKPDTDGEYFDSCGNTELKGGDKAKPEGGAA